MHGVGSTQAEQGVQRTPILKLFVACHKQIVPISHPILQYVQAGSALAHQHFADMAHDDEGEQISDKNRDYSELTALYWVWKNADADYYGFCHYRRFPSFDLSQKKRPYQYVSGDDAALIQKARLDCGTKVVGNYDLILPQAEKMFMTVTQHYQSSPAHELADLETAIDCLKRQYPEYSEDADAYLSDNKIFFGNIFVMKRDLFYQYCAWIFTILEEFDRAKKTVSCRAHGYVAERLLGIFVKHHIRTENTRIAFTQRIDIMQYFSRPIKRKILYLLCPPGTRRRAIVKKMLGTLQ